MNVPVGTRCRVLYDFSAVEQGELSVVANESVVVAEAGGASADGWVFVELENPRDGRVSGFVPADYIAPTLQDRAPSSAAAAGVSGVYPSPSAVYPGSSASAYVGGYGSPVAATPADALQPAFAQTGGSMGMSASAVLDAVAASMSPSQAPAPPLATPADYAALFASHEEWFKAASAKRADTYRGLQAEAMDIIRSLSEAESRSNALLSRISELDALIGEERSKWAAKVAEESVPSTSVRS